MLNPAKVHDNLWSIGLASMFNWSSVSVRQSGSGSGGGCDGESDGVPRLTNESGDPSSPNFEASSLYHFPFPTNLLSRNLQEETCSSIKEKLMKQAGGKSFTIDSLLGITNAAQVAIQNCMLPGHQCSSESKWIHEKVQYEHGKDSRFSPYHNNLRKDRTTINIGTSTMITSEKSGEKLQKGSRRVTKSKRVRTIFTPEQLERLEAEFERQQYMVGPERLYLASSLYLTEAQVKVWFQNRRIKWRKQHLEMQQQRLAVFRSKQSSLGNDDGEDYEEDSEGSISLTLPPSESQGSLNNLPLVTTFSGSLLQESLNCPNKEVHPESNVTSPLPFTTSRRPLALHDSSLYLKHQQIHTSE